jgi:fructoselysine-6-P-deglycase FrlB-like protein
LPQVGDRVAVVGCGTSWFIAQSYAWLREELGNGETDAFAASEMPVGRAYDVVLAISRSGTTTEVLRLMEALPKDVGTVAITAAEDVPIAAVAGRTVALSFADEGSVVQTRFATSTLALLRAHSGHDLAPAILDAELVADASPPVNLTSFDHFVFLGSGWATGLAHEAALKMREAAGAWAESYPAMEYRHGPISIAGSRSLVWALGNVDGDLFRTVQTTGATAIGGSLDPLAELVLVQRTAVGLAEARGLDPARPRHLSRSVVLE